MSEENVEVVRRFLEALNNEDFDVGLELVHPEIEFVPPGGQTPRRGSESLRRWMEPDAFQNQVVEPLAVIDATDTTVLAKHHVTARGASSGIVLDVISWSVWAFDADGLVTRARIYMDHEEERARAAAESGDS